MTILFKDDWLKWPGAILDLETPNRSFVDMSVKLKRIGVKNHSFMLALYNPDLLGVDPHSDGLTIHQKAAIAIECKQNFWYQVRNVWKAPSLAGNSALRTPILANRANLALWWSFFNHVVFILTQPRQTGKSFCTDVLNSGLMNFICEKTQINLVTKDDTLRATNIRRLKEIYDELPPYLNFKTRLDSNNTETITIAQFENVYMTHVAQASIKKAANTLRGQSSPIIQFDEPPFQANIQHSLPAAVAAMGAAAEQADLNGEPHGLILTTTAGKRDEPSGKYIYDYANDSAKWSDRFYDCKDIVELERMVRTNSRRGVYRIYGPFSHRQVGKTDHWMRDMLEKTNATPEEANRDFFNRWTSGNATSPIPVDLLEVLNQNACDDLHNEIWSIGGFILRWQIDEPLIAHYMLNHNVVVGIDTSDASGNDSISMVGVSVTTGETVFTGEFNVVNLIAFAQFLVAFLVKYTNTVMIIERKSSGVTIIDYLLMFLPQHDIDPFTRLFNWVINDPAEHKALYTEVQTPMGRRDPELYARAKKTFGFATSSGGQTSRSDLYSKTLINAVRRCAALVKDRTIIAQISGLIIKNGRIDHAEGEHDDMVIGFLLGHWFVTMAKNLSAYGIDPSSILQHHKQREIKTPEQFLFDRKQKQIRARIAELFELMTSELSPIISQRYEAQLNHLASQIVLEANESFSIDAMIEEIKKRKQAQHSVGRGEYVGAAASKRRLY